MSTDDLGELPKLMVLSPFGSWFEADSVVPGSHTYRADCGHLTWISPQGSAFLEQYPDTMTVCMKDQPYDPNAENQKFAVPGARKALDNLMKDPQMAAEYERFVEQHGIREWPA